MNGVNALIVEEEYLIAADIEQAIREAGAVGVEIFRDVEEISHRPVSPGRFQLAVVEAKLGHPAVVAFAEELRGAGVAVVVTSADRAVISAFGSVTGLEKPFDLASVLRVCQAALGAAASRPTVR